MTVSRSELERLTPEDMAQYLRLAGWRPAGDVNGRATVWELPQRELEVIVPASTRFRDYPQRVYEIIRTLAAAEARPEPEIVRNLADPAGASRLFGPYVDRPHFRLFPDAPSGAIPATDAAEAFIGVRELFVAAAYAEHNRDTSRFVIPPRRPKRVREFPEKVLVATEPGSFVITASVSLPRQGGALFESDAPFERNVLLRMRAALLSARAAAREASEHAELTPFTERASEGVSKTLCRGLARFGGPQNDRPFEVGFGWASAAPVQLPSTPIRFAAEHVVMLAQAGEDADERPVPAQMRGKVRAMDRDRPHHQGWVVVRGSLTVSGVSRNRQVWIPLEPDDYDRALRAHGQGLEVRVSGVLTHTGRRAELRPTEYFRVL